MCIYNKYMKKLSAEEKKQIKELNAQIKTLQAKLAVAQKKEGIDPFIEVKVRKNQSRLSE